MIKIPEISVGPKKTPKNPDFGWWTPFLRNIKNGKSTHTLEWCKFFGGLKNSEISGPGVRRQIPGFSRARKNDFFPPGFWPITARISDNFGRFFPIFGPVFSIFGPIFRSFCNFLDLILDGQNTFKDLQFRFLVTLPLLVLLSLFGNFAVLIFTLNL